MTTVWVYVDTNHYVGHPDHLKVFATPDAADEWFKENDPEGVAFGYEVLGHETRPRSYCPVCGALIDIRPEPEYWPTFMMPRMRLAKVRSRRHAKGCNDGDQGQRRRAVAAPMSVRGLGLAK